MLHSIQSVRCMLHHSMQPACCTQYSLYAVSCTIQYSLYAPFNAPCMLHHSRTCFLSLSSLQCGMSKQSATCKQINDLATSTSYYLQIIDML
jgi:hypothetical protein